MCVLAENSSIPAAIPSFFLENLAAKRASLSLLQRGESFIFELVSVLFTGLASLSFCHSWILGNPMQIEIFIIYYRLKLEIRSINSHIRNKI